MEKCWFNSMLSNKKLEHRCGLSKSMDSFDALGHTDGSEEPILNDTEKNITSLDSSNLSKNNYLNYLFDSSNIWSLISDDTFLVRNSNGDSYSVYFDIENQNFDIDIDNAISFLSELDLFFSDSLNSESNSSNYYFDYSIYDTQSNWNNHINSCIDTYLSFEISLNSDIDSGIDSYITSLIYTESPSSIESENSSLETSNSPFDKIEMDRTEMDRTEMDTIEMNRTEMDRIEMDKIEMDRTEMDTIEMDTIEMDTIEMDTIEMDTIEMDTIEMDTIEMDTIETSNNFYLNINYKELWVQCENCYGSNYKKFLSSKMNICEYCGYHLKMSSSDQIKLLIDPGTWESMDTDMVSLDPIEFHSEEEPYIDRISDYQNQTGLTEAVQTGIGKLNSIPIAIGVMDFQFMGGSMGSVVGEKITRLIEYATNRFLPLIIVCASGGARMQEGSLSLMQMAKISSASYDYQSKKKLFYVSILTSPTTGGVTASFGMLGDIIIAEPNAYIAFAGKRVIEQTLNKTVPDGFQETEYLFHKGLFDPIVPRNLLKGVLNELFQLHGFLPLNND
uniref:Acetyl-CoA carboxylase beta subunit n=1 Tax=Lankesterella ceracifolia TaxID=683362 RepID=A0A6G8J215_9ASPA|nr:acetyl-CoA carboxylase beta subunit [Lankesterella ceracifolia]QIM61181.1 acetyl-CoA carboxylase beta subunit [Lankesterella ceracifolia]